MKDIVLKEVESENEDCCENEIFNSIKNDVKIALTKFERFELIKEKLGMDRFLGLKMVWFQLN